jgi:hypothetical protein
MTQPRGKNSHLGPYFKLPEKDQLCDSSVHLMSPDNDQVGLPLSS